MLLQSYCISQEGPLVGLPVLGHPSLCLDGQRISIQLPPTALPQPPCGRQPHPGDRGSSVPFLSTKAPLPATLTLSRHEDYSPGTPEEISSALACFLNSSAPGLNHIPYSVWKSLHHIRPTLLLSLLNPLLAHSFHAPSLQKALGIVLDKPGKPVYDSPSSFRIIILLCTLSKILERVAASRLSIRALTCSLIHPRQCCSLPRTSTVDAAQVLQQHVQSLHQLRHKASTNFLDIKGGLDNVESPVLLFLLRRKSVSLYLIKWISSFLRDRTCRLSFERSLPTFALVSVGVPQCSPISPVRFVIYLSSLYTEIHNSLTIFDVDPSPSW